MNKPVVHFQLNCTADSQRLFYTASPLARQHLAYIQEAGRFKALPGYYTERSGVSSYLLVYTTHGQGLLRYAGHTHPVRSGHVFLIDCRQHQYYAQVGHDPWVFDWVHVNGGCCQAYWKALGQIRTMLPGEPLPWADQEIFTEPISRLLQLCGKPGLQADIQAAGLVNGLLTGILLAAGQFEAAGSIHSPAVQTVLDLLQHDPGRSWSLADLAGRTAMNKQYLLRLFKRETGLTPLAYQQTLRIGMAKTLLRSTSQTVRMIAAAAGIDDSNYFIRLFKKMEGMTPVAYRKRWHTGN